MNIISSLKSDKYIVDLAKLGIRTFLINDEDFSSGIDYVGRSQQKQLIEKIHNAGCRAYFRVDRLYSEEELTSLEQYLDYLDGINADGVLFSDVAVYMLIKKDNLSLKTLYAPETLLTNKYDIKELKKEGFDGCVISKDIPLDDVFSIVDDIKDYCYLRIHGPVLVSYSARKFISVYTAEDKPHTDGYYLVEETRPLHMPIVEKKSGSWLYAECIESTHEINDLINKPFKGLIIDDVLAEEEYMVKTVEIYVDILNGLDSGEGYRRLIEMDENKTYSSLSQIKKTILDKE